MMSTRLLRHVLRDRTKQAAVRGMLGSIAEVSRMPLSNVRQTAGNFARNAWKAHGKLRGLKRNIREQADTEAFFGDLPKPVRKQRYHELMRDNELKLDLHKRTRNEGIWESIVRSLIGYGAPGAAAAGATAVPYYLNRFLSGNSNATQR